MDQLLKTLTDIFRITEPEDRIPHFCDHFLPQAKPVLYGSLNVHLDYCGLQEDDPSGQMQLRENARTVVGRVWLGLS